MSMYSNWLQPALQNLLQCVVWFFHPRLSCMMHISAYVFSGWKSLQWRGRKPAILSSCSVLPPEIVMHDDAYIGGLSVNNIKFVMHDDLGWKNHTTRYILPRHWLYEWFSQFHVVELTRSPSVMHTNKKYSGDPDLWPCNWCAISPMAQTTFMPVLVLAWPFFVK